MNTEVTVEEAHFKIGSEKKYKKMQFFEIFPLAKREKSGNLMVYKADNVLSDELMINSRKLLITVGLGLLVTTCVYADMTPASQSDAKRVQSSNVCSLKELQYTDFFSPSNYPSVAKIDLWSVEFLPEANAYVSQTSEIQHPQSLMNGPGSFNLCLSALIGLGLCSSAHWVKRISFGFVPEWYHNGGPFQIGHSFAVSPDSLCPASACCFIQPTCTAERLIPQYRLRAVLSLWRKSQFTPDVIALRGPPLSYTCELFPACSHLVVA